MTRVKKGTNANKSRKNVLRQVKGYRFGRSTKERQAYEAIVHAGSHAFAHRRDKKSDFRKLWNARINASVRSLGKLEASEAGTPATYSTFMGALKKKNILINRKMLADLAHNHPEVFNKIAKEAGV